MKSQVMKSLFLYAVGLISMSFFAGLAGWSFGWDAGYRRGVDTTIFNCMHNPKLCQDRGTP